MTNKTTPGWPLLMAFTLLALTAPVLVAADDTWVRIDRPDFQLADFPGLNDYGTFAWGAVSSSELQSLRSSNASVREIERPFALRLGGLRFDPLHEFPVLDSSGHPGGDTGPDFRLIQFQGPIRGDWLQDVRGAGIELVQYIHPFTYVVWANPEQLNAARGAHGVRWAGQFAPEFRVVPEQRGFEAPNEPTMLAISRYADEHALRARIEAVGGELLRISSYTSHLSLAKVIAPGQRYLDLGRIPGVYTVQRALQVAPRGEMRNQSIVGHFETNQDVTAGYLDWLTNTGYDGSGVIVSVIDGGIRETHQDLVGNISPCVSSGSPTSCTTNNNTHGTHVAGAIAGTGASGSTDSGGFLQGLGVAPGASVVQQRYNSPGLTYGFGSSCSQDPYCLSPSGALVLFREAALSGAVIANNSWGASGQGIGYDLPSQQIDALVRDANPDQAGQQPVLPVWAILNGGGDGAGCNSSSLSSPDEAKNIFGIGSTELRPGSYAGGQIVIPNPSDLLGISANSAHGLACDGRQVPQIVAPGCGTLAPAGNSNSAYTTLCGTSMAAPTVAGAAAVFFEYYRDQMQADPSPAMIKAAFTATAVDLEGHTNADGGVMGHRPDRFQGYGRLDLDAVVNPPYNVMYFDQQDVLNSSGEVWTISLSPADPGEPVRIMLAWTDAQGHGLAGTTEAWVNDLDLMVEVGADVYRGNHIGPDGWSQAGGGADGMNNLEAVYLRPDQHNGGGFDLTVLAANIAADALNPHNPDAGNPSQDFALVCYNCAEAVTTFALSLDPGTADVCIPRFGSTQVNVQVNVAAAPDYAGTVALSTSGEPDAVSSTLDPDSVTPPGQSTWTLSVGNTATAGTAPVTLSGDDGEETQHAMLSLALEAELPAPELIAPAHQAFGVDWQPAFSWEALSGADEYQIQIATDTIFIANVIMDETVTGTGMTATVVLEPGRDYFWRVRGNRNCGGAWSEIYSFTTAYNSGELAVSPAELDFGGIDTGAISVLTATVEHIGGVDLDALELTVIESTGDAFAVVGGSCDPGTSLPPGGSCTLEVGFSPTAAGATTGSVVVTAIDHQEVHLTLNGTGIPSGPIDPVEAIFQDRFETSEPALRIVSNVLPDVHVLEHYEATLQAENGVPPYTWAVDGLPGGFYLDAATGQVTHNPVRPAISGAGGYSVTFEVTDAEGNTARATLPLTVIGIEKINVGDGHSCAISTVGRGYCWGHNDQGQLGNGSIGAFGEPSLLPTRVVDPDHPDQPLTGLVDITAWRYHTCALTDAGTVYCWGWDAAGRLGSGTSTGDAVPIPTAVVDPDNPAQPLAGVTGITVGEMHGCASTESGVGYCWGDNFYGQIGTTTTGHHLVPTPVVDPQNHTQPLAGITQLGAGTFHTCAVIEGGAAYCWGWNVAGQLGNNTSLPGQVPTPFPQPVVDPDNVEQPFTGFAYIEGGNVHTCGLTVDDSVYCWGQNAYGQLGNDNAPSNSLVPARVHEPGGTGLPFVDVASIDPGGLQSCAIDNQHNAYCWGSNDHGQLGIGDNEDRPVPVAVIASDDTLTGFSQVRTNREHSCGVSQGGIVYCWGANELGALGDGTRVSRNVPVPVRAGVAAQ